MSSVAEKYDRDPKLQRELREAFEVYRQSDPSEQHEAQAEFQLKLRALSDHALGR
jgi:hypothetical protein